VNCARVHKNVGQHWVKAYLRLGSSKGSQEIVFDLWEDRMRLESPMRGSVFRALDNGGSNEVIDYWAFLHKVI
jgi:hypothetical protein